MSLRLVFMGTPDFAVPVLRAFLEAGDTIAAVYSQPPRPAGRGHKLTPSPVQAFAEGRGLMVRHPVSLKNAEAQAEFAALNADAAIVVAYGLILPKAVLEAPRLGCFNLHASLLPRWRGAAPMQRALLAGDAETGVCAMKMDEGLDTGPVLDCERVAITPRMTISELHDELSAKGAALIVRAVHAYAEGRIAPRPQPAEGVTYAAKLGRDEGRIDWTRSAAEIDRMVRALNPGPGTHFELNGERIKLLAAEPVDARGAPGTLLDDAGLVACGDGALRLLKLQRAGKAALDIDAFLRGFPLPKGTRLS
ncbi:MAG TPA: methionyl-tRNA formyltransferase [Ferrovibrio sp.]|uniref:methionyl-tRNA formyltransferase n=1 Tax=Ferrovibrio sp. TaxID=1917215 RepID=UPI002B4B05B1|nr:methionyl-tRNA formyltransferase [Ferrovibrio sp.]HLT76147.1 methionyl-tRNA formyltransferase [Ferrovibrio sp.]